MAMPKRETPFVNDYPYHVYSRGVAKQDIFHDDKDRKRFLLRAEKYLEKLDIKLLSYCLMPNHFHLILWQKGEFQINKYMSLLLISYSMYFNKKYDRVGPVFQGRFKDKVVTGDEYLLQ